MSEQERRTQEVLLHKSVLIFFFFFAFSLFTCDFVGFFVERSQATEVGNTHGF